MKKLIFYDLDGTLVDTRDDIAQSVNHMLRQLGKPPLPIPAVTSYVGKGLKNLIANCLQENESGNGILERAVEIYHTHYTEHLLDQSRLYPGVLETLTYFKNRKQAVVTNKPSPYSIRILEGLGVADYFIDMIAGENEYPRKPDPAGMKALLEKNNVSPEEALLIGDSCVDVQTGRNAGVFTIVLSQGFEEESALKAAEPDALVCNFKECLKLVQNNRW